MEDDGPDPGPEPSWRNDNRIRMNTENNWRCSDDNHIMNRGRSTNFSMQRKSSHNRQRFDEENGPTRQTSQNRPHFHAEQHSNTPMRYNSGMQKNRGMRYQNNEPFRGRGGMGRGRGKNMRSDRENERVRVIGPYKK